MIVSLYRMRRNKDFAGSAGVARRTRKRTHYFAAGGAAARLVAHTNVTGALAPRSSRGPQQWLALLDDVAEPTWRPLEFGEFHLQRYVADS